MSKNSVEKVKQEQKYKILIRKFTKTAGRKKIIEKAKQ